MLVSLSHRHNLEAPESLNEGFRLGWSVVTLEALFSLPELMWEDKALEWIVPFPGFVFWTMHRYMLQPSEKVLLRPSHLKDGSLEHSSRVPVPLW